MGTEVEGKGTVVLLNAYEKLYNDFFIEIHLVYTFPFHSGKIN